MAAAAAVAAAAARGVEGRGKEEGGRWPSPACTRRGKGACAWVDGWMDGLVGWSVGVDGRTNAAAAGGVGVGVKDEDESDHLHSPSIQNK